MNFEGFKEWLEAHEYSPTTRRAAVQQVNYAHRMWLANQSLPPSARKGAKLYLGYVQNTKDRSLFADALEKEVLALRSEDKRFGPRKSKRRKQEARSIDDVSWRSLTRAIAEDTSDEARVLEVMATTGLRIGDVLRVTKPALRNALRTGRLIVEVKGQREVAFPIEGSMDVWDRLYTRMNDDPQQPRGGWQNVAHWVCPAGDGGALAGDCAYARVHRRLKKICAGCELTERIHLHRLRRTVAVQALRMTEDIRVVRDLLGHASLKSTSAYLDEAKPEAIINIQKQLRERFQR